MGITRGITRGMPMFPLFDVPFAPSITVRGDMYRSSGSITAFNSLQIEFPGDNSPGFKTYNDNICHQIPLRTKNLRVIQDLEVAVRDLEPAEGQGIAYYFVISPEHTGTCTSQNLQMVVRYYSNTVVEPDTEQLFTASWSHITHWKEISEESEEWELVEMMAAAPGDTVYRIGDGWGVDREDVEFRQGGNIVPARSTKEISDTRVPQDLDKTFSSEMSPHKWASDQKVGKYASAWPWENRGLRMGVSNPDLTRQKRREGRNILRSRKKKNPTKETSNEPPDEKIKLEQLRLKEDIFLDSLDPEKYAQYIDDVARVQSGIKKLGGYMPVPLGTKSRYTDSQLNALGFQLLPDEEQRIQKEQEADPDAYSKRVMGMSWREMVGNIVPTLDDWEANDGTLSVNTEVPSPRRITGGRRDLRDMNARISRFTTYHELWHLLHSDEIRKEDGV